MGAQQKPRIRVRAGTSNVLPMPAARYEAAEPSRLRNFYRHRGTQNELVQRDAVALRNQSRYLVRNHDIARGMLRTLVNNVVGPNGIGIEPQPRRRDGSIHKQYARDLLEAHREWNEMPEVTHRFSWRKVQRMLARAWFRDGEAFAQEVIGSVGDRTHGSAVPYSLELFEADMVPHDLNDSSRQILQGIELNTWGRPIRLHVHKTVPWLAMPATGEFKAIPWERVIHLASIDHIGQLRGVTEFASIITRLEDIKDYEESERVAAKIAAMLAAAVIKGTPDLYEPPGDGSPRELSLSPGMIIDDLLPGESIELIDSKRPNPNLITFRGGQLRAAAAGIGVSYSSTAKDYNGTFSAQRQELVEQWVHYAVLTDDFVSSVVQPVWKNWVMTAHLSGVVPMPKGLKPGTHDDALFVGQSMPWIDPLKEALAWERLVAMGFASEVEVMRKRGVNPHDLLEQVTSWRQDCADRGVAFEGDRVGLERLLDLAAGE